MSDVPLGRRAHDLHCVRSRNVSEGIIVDIIPPERRRKIVEVSDHRRRKVEVQFTARNVANTEPVPGTLRNEDERPRRADNLSVLQRHDVLASQDVERLGTIVMDVNRGPEVRRFVGLEDGHDSFSLADTCLHGHAEVAQVNEPTLTWSEHVRLRIGRHGGEVRTVPVPRSSAVSRPGNHAWASVLPPESRSVLTRHATQAVAP